MNRRTEIEHELEAFKEWRIQHHRFTETEAHTYYAEFMVKK